jgi:type II secretory pathway component PulF
MAKYKVKTKIDNTVKHIVVEADSKMDAMSLVESDYGVMPIDVKIIGESSGYDISNLNNKKLKFRDVLYIFQEIHILISSGISLKDALLEVKSTSEEDYIKVILEQIILGLNQGKTFSSLMAEYYDAHSIVISVLRVGEKGGELDKILDVVITYLEDADKNISSVVKALSYPMILIVFTFLSLILLLSFVVPQFSDIFKSFGHDLPIYTSILISMSNFVIDYGMNIFIGFIAIIIMLFYKYKSNYNFRFFIDKILMSNIYIVSKTLNLNSMYKMTSSFAILLFAGINVVDSLDMILQGIKNEYMRDKIKHTINSIKNGKTLANALKESNLLKSSTIRLIFAGENSGQTPEMMKKISEIYRKDLNGYIDIIAKLIEPFLLVFISGIVLFIALSIFMPIWSLSSGV